MVVNKLLLSKAKPIQYLLTIFGAFLGLLIVMGGIQVLQITQSILSQKDLLGGDFIVVNKKVSLLNTISGSSPSFSKADEQALRDIKGIDNIGRFTAGTFRVSMQLDGKMAEMMGPGIRTDLFFEAVPNEFVDTDPEDWQWSPSSSEVPIIIPADYIKLYNSAFAQSQGLPMIPESVIKSIGFDLKISGRGRETVLKGKILGFSQRINSILVPQSFLNWANANYGNSETPNPSRLILHSADPTSPQLASELHKLGYELNEEKLKSSELNNMLQILISVVSLVGILIVLLALLGFMQYNQLMAYRSAYEIQTLHWLGYPIKTLANPYIRFGFMSIGFTWLIASAAVYLLQFAFNGWLVSKGIEAELPNSILSIVVGFVISLIMATLSSLSAYWQVKELSK